MSQSILEPVDDPSWLLDPPNGPAVPPPAVSRAQLLPFGALTWQDFERLCLRLARLEGEAEHWQLYGTAGQMQGGIDIFVRSPGAAQYCVWQVKRYQHIKAADIKKAVDAFLKGPWAAKSQRFVFCTSALLDQTQFADAIERAAERLRAKNILLEVRGAAQLSERLKKEAEIVDDFFDRPWTERFCGRAAAEALGQRLGRSDYETLRARLKQLYAAHFAAVDPGVLRAAHSMANPGKSLSLAQRFVPTDFISTEAEQIPLIEDLIAAPPQSHEEWSDEGVTVRRIEKRWREAAPLQRVGLEQWAADTTRAILFGPPGAGKSTLLRFLALDLLSEKPRLAALKRRWPEHLPLLVSFPFWTRLIRDGQLGADISVPAVAKLWLQAHGEPDLARLATHAFEGRRVLLLVDGIDEWADEDSANTALTLLQTFAETRNVPVIVTSRPHGARLLRTLDASWKRHAIAPLSTGQQIDFANAWYAFLADQEEQPSGNSRARAQAFVAELSAIPDVAVLAGVPLLLGGLMALARQGTSLPRSRFQAYRELTERLITLHAQSRARAALTAKSAPTLDPQTRELVFAELAYAIQLQPTSEIRLDAISKSEALAHVKASLQQHLDVSAESARREAQALLNVGAEAIGILVEKSPQEIGFLHRAFQELLAAQHIDSLALDEQCGIMAERAHDPQWRDVLLFVAQFASRPGDIDRMVEAIESAPQASGSDASRQLLLAEVAFSEVRRTPQLTRRLAKAMFEEIHAGPDLDQRAEILRRTVSGLASEQTAMLVRPELRRWFPHFHPHTLAQALPLIAKWDEPEVDQVLWSNLQSDEEETREAAASALAGRQLSCPAWRERTSALLRSPPDLPTAATAITLLDLGFPGAETNNLIDQAARSDVLEIKAAGLKARIRGGRQTSEERDLLIEWMDQDHWEISRVAAGLLGKGWPHDPTLKGAVLRCLREACGPLDYALGVAAEGFGGDAEVASAIGDTFEKRGRFSGSAGVWPLLAKNFAGDGVLADRIASGRDDAKYDSPYYHYHAASIAPTPFLKTRLLEDIREPQRLRFWAVNALLDHWSNDAEVMRALRAVVDWPDEDLSRVADKLPQILGDEPGAAASHLMRLLNRAAEADSIHTGELAQALHDIGALAADPSLVDSLLDILKRKHPDSWQVEGTINRLLFLCPGHPLIEKLARECLRGAYGHIDAIASSFGQFPHMRQAILEVAAPLAASLRKVISEALPHHAVKDDWALNLLEEGRFDADGAIGALSVIRAAHSRLASGTLNERFLAMLEQELQALGPHYERRRIAAFIALATAGEEKRAVACLPRQTPLRISMARWQLRGSTEFDACLADNWVQVCRSLEEQDLADLFCLSDDEIVERFGGYVESRPDLRPIVDGAARRSLTSNAPSIPAIRYLLQEPANRPDVLEACLLLLNDGSSWSELSKVLDAAEVVGRYFAKNDLVHDRIVERFRKGHFSGPVAALCNGWPDSPLLNEVVDDLRKNEAGYGTRIANPLAFKLVAAKSSPPKLLDNFKRAAATMRGHIWDGIPYWSANMQRRIREDEEVRVLLMAHLEGSPTAAEKVSFAGYLARAAGMGPELLDWCRKAIEETKAAPLAEVGMDLWVGQPVLVWKRLSDLLSAHARM